MRPYMKQSKLRFILLLLLMAMCVTACSKSEKKETKSRARARIDELIVTSTESGKVVADNKTVISNQLKWSVVIDSVVEPGTLIKKGDLVVQFTCQELDTAIEQLEVEIANARMAVEQAKQQRVMKVKETANNVVQAKNQLKTAVENKEKFKKSSDSQLAKAMDLVKKAKEDLNRYIAQGGKWENDLKDANTAIKMNRKTLDIAKAKLAFKKKVNQNKSLNKPYSETELENAEIGVENLEIALEKSIAAKKLMIKYDYPNTKRQLEENVAQSELDYEILEKYTIPQETRMRSSAIAETKLNVDRSEIGRAAELRWADIEIQGNEKVLKKNEERLEEYLEEKAKLTVHSDRDGLVLFAKTRGRHGVELQVQSGTLINARTKLIEIPDMTFLHVETIIFESMNKFIKIKDEEKGIEGTEVLITMDSLPNTKIHGRVVKRSTLPKINGRSWMETGARIFELGVDADWEKYGLIPGQNLKPEMMCSAQVILSRIKSALLIPITAVYSEHGKYFCKKIDGSKAVEQPITIGLMNETDVQILSGLEKGDEVLLDVENIKSEKQ